MEHQDTKRITRRLLRPLREFDVLAISETSSLTLLHRSWSRLGKGSFGCVYKGEYLGLEVAIKEVMESGEYDGASLLPLPSIPC